MNSHASTISRSIRGAEIKRLDQLSLMIFPTSQYTNSLYHISCSSCILVLGGGGVCGTIYSPLAQYIDHTHPPQ